MKGFEFRRTLLTHGFSILMLCSLCSCVFYRKMNPPADADKPGGLGTDNSCYLATASNMLAAAGYGTGASLQSRAEEIYGEMTSHFGIVNSGWTDVALSWWLNSSHNTWSANPYKLVTVYGNKYPKYPWANPDGPMFYGNELRRCCMTGLSISWPTTESSIGSGGHAITDWGDDFGKTNPLTSNPLRVLVTDSDTDAGGNEQKYVYDNYNAPNPGGANEGNGWYFNYSNNHPYIKHIVTLCPTDDPGDQLMTQRVSGSYTIHQNRFLKATDLHYKVSTDVRILSYRTWLSWDTQDIVPVITESANKQQLTVDWDLSSRPIPTGTEVTIHTELVLPRYNALQYSDIYFTYPDIKVGSELAVKFAEIKWRIESADLEKGKLPNNVSGGYVLASFDLEEVNSKGERELFPYQLVHEYSFNQSPYRHVLELSGRESAVVKNLRVGHSWNVPDAESFKKFKDWITVVDSPMKLSKDPQKIELDWRGKFEYPEGENIYQAIPDKNGRQRKPDSKKK